jgi:hypothetical protein
MGERKQVVVWEPQPGPQTAYITCPVFEAGFGGARGGGKTDGSLGVWLSHADQWGANAIGLMVRRTLVELTETIERSKVIFTPLGGVYHAQEKMWRMPNGARLRFAYLENDSDADGYQGHNYTIIFVEEAGNFPSITPILKLMATLRSGAGVKCMMRLTFNPGGVGHHWVKARYIDPAPGGMEIIEEEFTNPFDGSKIVRERVFIPSKVTDNKYLGADYIANLQMSGSPALVKAWLEGDWNIIAGAYFPEFGQQHIIEPFEIPKHWPRLGGYDHGTARPYCFLWAAVADGEFFPEYPRGSLIFYREDYGWNGKPNEGLWLEASEIGRRIMGKNGGDILASAAADPSIFPSPKMRGPSIAEDLVSSGLNITRADNARLAGWNQLRKRLAGFDGKPTIYFFKTCVNTIRTLPALQHDRHDPNDCDTEGEDHAPDTCRYICMSRPVAEDAEKPEVINTAPPKMDYVLKQHFESRERSSWR